VNEAIVFKLGVYDDFAHYYVNVYLINILIRVKSASYRNYNRNYSFVNNLYFVNTSTLNFHNY
jgi:hypothetical protein